MRVVADPLQFVRSHPEMFLRSGVPTGREISLQLADDALFLGAQRVTVVVDGSVVTVLADVDWLRRGVPSECNPRDLFSRIVPFPEFGANAHRSELLVGAFAQAYASPPDANGDGCQTLGASAILKDNAWAKRFVMFRLA